MLSVLYVCTGNICRSPFAERYSAVVSSTGAAGPVRVSSAGIGALTGHPMDPLMAASVEAAGGDPAGFVARQITQSDIAASDVIITMESYHRDWILEDHPRAIRRTFSLGQLERHLDEPDVAGLVGEELLLELGRRRHRARTRDDVPDPYRRGPTAISESAARITTGLDKVLPRLVPPRTGSSTTV